MSEEINLHKIKLTADVRCGVSLWEKAHSTQ
jgi:hypothetical protein